LKRLHQKKEHKIRIYEFSYNHPQCSSLLPVLPIFYDEECHEIDVIFGDSYGSAFIGLSYDNGGCGFPLIS